MAHVSFQQSANLPHFFALFAAKGRISHDEVEAVFFLY